MAYFVTGSICFVFGFGVAWVCRGAIVAKMQAELAALKASATNAVNKL